MAQIAVGNVLEDILGQMQAANESRRPEACDRAKKRVEQEDVNRRRQALGGKSDMEGRRDAKKEPADKGCGPG